MLIFITINIMKITFIKNSKFKKIISFIFFSLTFIYSHSLTNLYYDSSKGPDIEKYRRYLDFLTGNVEYINLEQNPIYFYLVSKTLEFNSRKLIFSEYENLLSFSIQSTNYFIYLFSLIGVYKLLRIFKVEFINIMLTLSMVNFFSSMLTMRVTMKPEILGFALFIWSLYYFEKFLIEKRNFYLYLFTLIFAFSVSQKISISAMIILFYFFGYYKTFINLKKKKLFTIIIIFISIFTISQIESKTFTGNFLTQAEHDAKYDNKASFSVIYNINFLELVKEPYEDKHKNSMLGIFLLDTFDDYFNIYWNYDKGILENSQKSIITTYPSSSYLFFDVQNKSINYSGPFKFYIQFIREYFSIALTILFFSFIIKFKNQYRLFIASPLIGMFVLIINNVFGIPSNNFDPTRGDTFKTFYISMFLTLSFMFINTIILKKLGKLKLLYVIIFIFIALFIIGFPISNNSYSDALVSINNSYSIYCEVNLPFLQNTLFETNNLKCTNIKAENLEIYKVIKTPILNFSIIILILFFILFENKFSKIKSSV